MLIINVVCVVYFHMLRCNIVLLNIYITTLYLRLEFFGLPHDCFEIHKSYLYNVRQKMLIFLFYFCKWLETYNREITKFSFVFF